LTSAAPADGSDPPRRQARRLLPRDWPGAAGTRQQSGRFRAQFLPAGPM